MRQISRRVGITPTMPNTPAFRRNREPRFYRREIRELLADGRERCCAEIARCIKADPTTTGENVRAMVKLGMVTSRRVKSGKKPNTTHVMFKAVEVPK